MLPRTLRLWTITPDIASQDPKRRRVKPVSASLGGYKEGGFSLFLPPWVSKRRGFKPVSASLGG